MGIAAAVGLASVAFSATAILTSVALVGTVLSVVGTVTHNKTLSQIGMGLGLVGGIGALATSALGLSSTALFGTQAAASTATDAATAAVGEVGSTTAGGWTVAAPDAVGSLATDATSAATTPVVSEALPAPVAGAADPAAAIPGAADGASAAGGATAPAATATTAPASATTDAGAVTAGDLAKPPPLAAGDTSASALDPATGLLKATPDAAQQPGILGKLVDYAGKHQTLAYGAVQGVSSLLSGWTSELTPAQIAQANATAAANQAQADFSKQQLSNIQAPKAVASLAPVTGTAAPLVPNAPGFINQAPTAPAAAVTGKAA